MVVGLGNPEARYNWTRHNFGFLTLDFYLKLYNGSFSPKSHLGAITCLLDDVLFVEPQEYYNLSGVSVANLARYYKIAPEDILVVCDDFNLKFGQLRYRAKGSAGGNNGLKSVISELRTEEFPRLRLGTGNTDLRQKIGDVDFVLSRFTPEEKERLPEILSEAAQKIADWTKN